MYVRQFSVLNGLRLYLSDLLRAILDPYAKVTYAQGGEDAVLRALLGNKPGFYVEVGANHPQYFSNVFELYRRGWHGVSIEANERLIAKHRRIRPRDQAVCALVSNEERDVTFTEFDEPLVSSVDPDFVNTMTGTYGKKIVAQRTMRTKTLTRILGDCGAPKQFDLLSIDVEGHDFEVLVSLDLDRYRPRLIVIEMHGFAIERQDDDPICRHLRRHGYTLAGHVATNSYFQDSLQAGHVR